MLIYWTLQKIKTYFAGSDLPVYKHKHAQHIKVLFSLCIVDFSFNIV